MRSSLRAALLVTSASLCSLDAAAFVITLDSDVPHPGGIDVGGAAYEDHWVESIFPESYPLVETLVATSPLGGVSTMSIDLSEGRFAWSCEVVRVAEELGYSGCGANVVFRVDEPAVYRITGNGTVSNEVGEEVGFGLRLQMSTAPFQTLFYDEQQSQYSPNVSFDENGWGGDWINSHDGSLTGTLEPNRPYTFGAGIGLQRYEEPSENSAATAQFVLTVPEPASAVGLATGALALTLVAARRRGGAR